MSLDEKQIIVEVSEMNKILNALVEKDKAIKEAIGFVENLCSPDEDEQCRRDAWLEKYGENK
jgi:hypothetical protein